MKRKTIFIIIGIVLILGLLYVWASHYFLRKEFLEKTVARFGQSKGLFKEFALEDIQYGKRNIFKNIELRDLAVLPKGSLLQIQELAFEQKAFSFDPHEMTLEIDNARLVLPGMSDPIVVFGSFKNGVLDFNIFARALDTDQFLKWYKFPILKKFFGEFHEVDLYLHGPFKQPRLRGEFVVKKIQHKRFNLEESHAQVSLEFEIKPKEFTLKKGRIDIADGRLFGSKTAVIALEKSWIDIEKNFEDFEFYCQGQAKVEGTQVFVKLIGSLDQPQLDLSSEPAKSKDQLLVMLMTNKSWQGTEASLKNEQITTDLVKDFIDYFAFNGKGSKIGEQLGIKDVHVVFNAEQKGVGLTKKITSHLDAGYEVTQTKDESQLPQTRQKVSGKIFLTNEVSLEAQKEIIGQKDEEKMQPVGETKVFLKMKKDF